MTLTLNDSVKLKEKDLSKASLVKMRVLLLLGLPGFPLLMLTDTASFSNFARIVFLVFVVLSCLCFACVIFSRLLKRFGRTESELDEWERDVKKSADAFGYRMNIGFVYCALLPLMGYEVYCAAYPSELTPLFSVGLGQILTGTLCLLFLFIYPRYAYILWTVRSIEDEDAVKNVASSIGRKAALLAGFAIAGYFAVIASDMVYDASYDYKAQCVESSVKRVTNKGLFKIDVECF